MPPGLKRLLVLLHRWTSLLLAPLLLVIIATGGLLALEPINQDLRTSPAAEEPLSVEQLRELLSTARPQQHGTADPQRHARTITLEQGDTALIGFSYRGERWHEAFAVTDGAPRGERALASDFFRTVRHLHKDLLLGLAVIVEAGSYALAAILLLGPLLAWPRLRRSLGAWHTLIGWTSLPLALALSVTGLLMALELGTPQLPQIHREEGRWPIQAALDQAEAEGVSHIYAMERFERAAWAVDAERAGERQELVITRSEVTPVRAYPGWVTEIHEGTWASGWSGLLNLLVAAILLFLLGSGIWLWGQRLLLSRRRQGDPEAELLIAHASQTGTAARLASATAKALKAAGARAQIASLAALHPQALNEYPQVLLIVATTGDGEIPDTGRRFLAAVPKANLSGTRYAMLALGDASYRRFCAAGETLRSALQQAGAEEVLPMARADGDPRPAWQTWLREAGELLGLASIAGEAPQADRPVTLTLARREQLNDPHDPVTHEAWALELTSAEPLDFRPGDLLLITPRTGEPARPYSIGSTPLEDPHRLLLTVAVTSRTDEQGRTRAGQVSSLLGRQLPIGASLHATLRRHEHLHPPEDPSQPIILIAAGCGIAPFIGFLAERERQPEAGLVWLIFGNRRRHGDFFHGERLLAWREQGVLTRLDLAFSRDEEDGSYIQDRLHEASTELIAWLTQHGARLYACGRRNTVGEGVRATLAVALIEHELVPDADHADRQLAQWEQEGRLRFDVID